MTTQQTDVRRAYPLYLRGLLPRPIHVRAHREHVLGRLCPDVCVAEPPHPSFASLILIEIRTGREYAAADARWGTADPTIVSLELLTVLIAGPMAAFIVYQIVKRDPARHYWIIVLSTGELYGGYVLPVFRNV